MKKLSLFAFILFLTANLYGQEYISLIKYDTSMPTGEFETYISNYSWVGFEIGSKKYMSRNSTVGFFVGWNVFDQKTQGTFNEGTTTATGTMLRYVNAFPIMLNAHYYLGRKRATRPYLGVNLGTYYIEDKVNLGIFTVLESNWHLGFAPEIGIMIPMGGSHLDLAVKYNYALAASGTIDYTWIGFNIGFAFNH